MSVLSVSDEGLFSAVCVCVCVCIQASHSCSCSCKYVGNNYYLMSLDSLHAFTCISAWYTLY